MTIITKMEDNNVVAGLERTHADMDPCQYVREIYQNSVEAGATDIRFTIDRHAHKLLGIERGIGIDNGPGIPKDKIKDLINKKNSSSKKTGGHDENFGVGLKVAALPRNQYGLIVICRTKERPKGFMIWLAYGKDQDNNLSAGLKGLISEEQLILHEYGQISEPLPKELIDFEEFEAEYDSFTIDGIDWMSWWDANSIHQTGTAVILCGNSKDENTFDHLIFEGKRFLTSRYLNFKVKPYFGIRRSRDRGGVGSFKTKNTQDQLINHSIDHGVLDFNSWRIYYFILDADKDTTQSDYDSSATLKKRFIEAILYKNELYGDFEHLSSQATASIRNSWGIYHKSVGDLITLIVEPPVYTKKSRKGVYPNEARSKLSWKSPKLKAPVQTIPLDEVKKFFVKNMPESIKELIEDKILEEMQQLKESKAAQEYSKWLSIPKEKRKSKKGLGLCVANEKGDHLCGMPTGDLFDLVHNRINSKSSSKSKSDSKTKKEPSAEELEKREQKRKARELAEKKRQEPPKVYWYKQKHEQAEEWFKRNGHWQAAFYEKPGNREESNILRINQDHDFMWGYINVTKEWLKIKGYAMSVESIKTNIVKAYWDEYGPCMIQQGKSIPSTNKDPNGFDPERLTVGFYGQIHHFKSLINKYWKEFKKDPNN